MNANIFNICLLIGWLLALAGGVYLNVGAGLVAGGILLLVIVFAVARVAGVYVPAPKIDEGTD
jgi:hypothetical protein